MCMKCMFFAPIPIQRAVNDAGAAGEWAHPSFIKVSGITKIMYINHHYNAIRIQVIKYTYYLKKQFEENENDKPA